MRKIALTRFEAVSRRRGVLIAAFKMQLMPTPADALSFCPSILQVGKKRASFPCLAA